MRKTSRLAPVLPFLVAVSVINLPLSTTFAQGTAFTYQGRLNDAGTPASGTYDLRFALYDSAANGNAIGNPLTNAATAVSNGLFATTLDFGPGLFTGSNYWIDVAVRTNGGAGFTELAPRQPLMPAPYAIMANTASNLLGTLPAGQLSGPIGNNNLPASATFSGTVAANSFSGDGGSLTNLNASKLASGTVPLAQLPGAVLTNNESASITLNNNLTLNGTLNLPATVAMTSGGFKFLRSDGNNNLFTGVAAGLSTTSGFNNTAYGYNAFASSATGNSNTAVGYLALGNLGSFIHGGGTNNIAVGNAAGSAFIGSESGNIDIGHAGVEGENNTIRIGTPGVQTSAFIAGNINGNGGGLTNLNASQLASGTIEDPRLSTNVALLNASQTFTGANTFSNNSTTFGTSAGSVAVINDGGVVPGITASGGLASGHLRFRNALEVWPTATASAGGSVDVRNTNGSPTITLTGSTGSITASNVTANTVSGSGAGLTNLNASQLSSGTVPLTQLPAAVITNTQTAAVTLNGPVTAASLSVTNQLRLNDRPLYFRAGGDANHGLAYNGSTVTNFGNGNVQVDGPVLWGFSGGALAVMNGGAHPVLNWSNGGVAINGTLSGDGSGLTNTTTAANYAFAFDSTTQTNTPGTFHDVTFDTTRFLSGWSHTAGTAPFTCNQSGLYLIHYSASARLEVTNQADNTTLSVQAVNNGAIILGSDAHSYRFGSSNLAGLHYEGISQQFLASFNSGDVLKFEWGWQGDFAELIPVSVNTTSFSCTIVRIQ